MTAPAAWQFRYNGVTVGDGTQYQVDTVAGLLDLPAVRSYATQRDGFDGVYVSPWFLNARVVTFTMTVVPGAVSALRAVQQLTSAWSVLSAPGALGFKAGAAGAGMVFGRPTKIASPVDVGVLFNTAKVSVEFTCDDPYIYGYGENAAGPLNLQYQNTGPAGTFIPNTAPGAAVTYPLMEWAAVSTGTDTKNWSLTGPGQPTGAGGSITFNTPHPILYVDSYRQRIWTVSSGVWSGSDSSYSSGSFPAVPVGATMNVTSAPTAVWWSDTYLSGGPQ